jgi:hypothetical protein
VADRYRRDEGYPSLTAREHWGKYALGILTETVFILALAGVALLLALFAMWIW